MSHETRHSTWGCVDAVYKQLGLALDSLAGTSGCGLTTPVGTPGAHGAWAGLQHAQLLFTNPVQVAT